MRVRLGHIGQTTLYLHTATLLVGIYAALLGFGPLLAISTLSILLHEGAHGVVAALLGYPPSEVELTPLGAMLRLEEEERLPPFRRALVLLAGPLTTLLLCLAGLLAAKRNLLPTQTAYTLFMANLGLLLLNLLPALPLDGGRLLALFLSAVMPEARVRQVLRALGTALGLALVALNVWISWRQGGWNFSLALAGCAMLYGASAATTSRMLAELRSLMDRKTRLEIHGAMPACEVAVLADITVHTALARLSARRLTTFTVYQRGTMARLGALTEFELASACLEAPAMTCGAALERRDRESK